MSVHRQRVLRTHVPAVNRFEGASSSTKSHKTIKSSERFAKGPTTSTKFLSSLTWDLRTCVNVQPVYFELRSWARFLASDYIEPVGQHFDLNQGFTVIEVIRWRVEWSIKKETSDFQLSEITTWVIVSKLMQLYAELTWSPLTPGAGWCNSITILFHPHFLGAAFGSYSSDIR